MKGAQLVDEARSRHLLIILCGTLTNIPLFYFIFLNLFPNTLGSMCHYLNFRDEEIEAWRGLIICPCMARLLVTEGGGSQCWV